MIRNMFINLQEHFRERFKEHLKVPSPIYEHCNITVHHTSVENFSIVGMESQNPIITIKEAINMS